MGVERKVEDDSKQLRLDEEHRIPIEQATQGAAQLWTHLRFVFTEAEQQT